MKQFYLFCSFFLFTISFCFSQEFQIQGKVIDEKGEPIIGASIKIKGTLRGTTSDLDGRFSIKITPKKNEKPILIFNYIGKQSISKSYDGSSNSIIVLKDKSQQLPEFVVRSKSNINDLDIREKTGFVNKVNVKVLKHKPTIDLGIGLQGTIPGLTIVNQGDLGSKPKIRIRGNSSFLKGKEDFVNEPLYVLDGKIINSEVFRYLNPDDIKEIKILKDAVSTALYGVKAANGVIEISSRRGIFNMSNIVCDYSLNIGITSKGRRGIHMMKTAEKLELERLLKNPKAPGYLYSEEHIRSINKLHPERIPGELALARKKMDYLKSIDTDWFDELMRTSFYQNHSLTITNGSNNFSYMTSLSMKKQNGIIPGNGIQSFSARLNIDQRLPNHGIFMLSTYGGITEYSSPNGGNNYSPETLTRMLNPYETTTDTLYSYPGRTLSDIMNEYKKNKTMMNMGTTASLIINLTKHLNVSTVTGIDLSTIEDKTIIPGTSYEERYYLEQEKGTLKQSKSIHINFTNNVRVNFDKRIKDHHFSFSANNDYYITNNDNLGVEGHGIGELDYVMAINSSLTGNKRTIPSGKKSKIHQYGFGFIGGYEYRNLFNLALIGKTDASSMLSPEKRWNKAWGASFNCHLAAQKWMQWISSTITNLDLKISFGQVANLNGFTKSMTHPVFYYRHGDFYANSPILSLKEKFNPNLKPEQMKTLDIGISSQIRNNFSFNINYYRKYTIDALMLTEIDPSEGYLYQFKNIGSMINEGIEFDFNCSLVKTESINLSLSAMFAYNKNKVINLNGKTELYTSHTDVLPTYRIGEAMDLMYGLKSLGINSITGLPTFEGKNKRRYEAYEKSNKEDYCILGHREAPITASLSPRFSYKNLSIYTNFYISYGGMMEFSKTLFRDNYNANKNAIQGQIKKTWWKRGDQNKIYSTPFNGNFSQQIIDNLSVPNSRTIGANNFIRMNQLSIDYRIPTIYLKNFLSFIKQMNIGIQAANLFVISPYRDTDPESGLVTAALHPVYTINCSIKF